MVVTMTCNIKEQKTDYYQHEKDDIANFKVDQTVIINEKYLKHIPGLHRECSSSHECPSTSQRYPFVNSYYPFTEDVDALERANHIEEKPSFLSLDSLEGGFGTEEPYAYSEHSAQQLYLSSKPVSFIIIGKPGIGEQELGRKLADFWHCVYIEPDMLVREEIESRSRAGQCIEFNLRCGRAIGIDVILRLVLKRVNSESAKHRGFVICGLPLIPNDLYDEDPISSEAAVFTAKEIFEEIIDTTVEVGNPPPTPPQVSVSSKYVSNEKIDDEEEEEEEERQEDEQAEEEEHEELEGEGAPMKAAEPVKTAILIPPDYGGEYDVCHFPEIGTNYEDQLDFLFTLMTPPFLVIYMMCNNVDVITKRQNYRFDIYSQQNIDLLSEKCNKQFYQYLSNQQNNMDGDIPEELFQTGFFHDKDSSNAKHLVNLPENFPAHVSTQLDAYHYMALNFIELRILMHDPQYFLKVDGRTSVHRMLNLIKARLKCLPVQSVVLPRPMNDFEDADVDVGEGGPLAIDNKGLSLEENFKILSKRQVPSSIFKWHWSDWGTICPVSLRCGFYRIGDPNFAVQFMNMMYFLADEYAFLEFYRNPRPFLLTPFPKPNCKFFIFGPKCSGKTAVANCLSYLLNGTVISIADLMKDFFMQKEGEYKEKLRQAAMAEAIDILNAMRKEEAAENEAHRVAQIKEWAISVRDMVLELIDLLNEMNNEMTVTKFEISSFPMAMKKVDVAEIETETSIAARKIRDQLEVFKIPVTNDPQVLENLIHDRHKLFSYLPDHLKKKILPKPATIFDEFVMNYADEKVANADLEHIDINKKNMVDMFINTMKRVEDDYLEQGNNRGGWILDGMVCDTSIIEELYPDFIADEILVLVDTSKNFSFLKNRFLKRGENIFRNHREFLMDIGKIDAAYRAPSQISTESYKTTMARDIIFDIIEDNSLFHEEFSVASTRVENYQKELLKFEEKWKETKQFFQKLKIDPIEIPVTDLTIPDLMKEIIRVIEDRYRVKASRFTEGDRAEEVQNFGNQIVQDEELYEGPSTIGGPDLDIIQKNRRYGDTFHYCPVTFYDKWVLWKGKEDFAAKFRGAVYLLSSESDMNKFLVSPRSYLTDEPPKEIPPPRICVVGVPRTGKTTICKNLSNNFGLSYVSFADLLKKYFGISSTESLDVLKTNKNIDSSLYDYLNFNNPLPEVFYENVLSKLWFDYPVKQHGFVIDNFPKRPSDIQFMIKYKLIPDQIIELIGDDIELKTALVETFMANWQSEMEIKRQRLEDQNKDIIAEWEEKRQKRFIQLLEEKKEKRYADKKKEKKEKGYVSDNSRASDDPDKDMGVISQVSFDSIAEQQDVDEVNRILDVEIPEVQIDSFGNVEETRKKYQTFLTETFTLEMDALKKIQVLCSSELIPFTQVIVDLNFPDKTLRSAFYLVGSIKNRTLSIFERCYDVSMEVAERLMSCGYFFLSKFGKCCPVQYFENKNPFQMFLPMEAKYNVYPVIHRSYIYYVIGRDSLEKFKTDPLKYVNIKTVDFPLIPHKVAVIGPPKCGKSLLAQRIRDEYGMKVITRGQAARYVLTYLPFSSLAQNMEAVLRQGWELTDEMIAKCVEAASFDAKAVTQGMIFDGFPNTISEVKHLSNLSMVPHLVIDLRASRDEVFQCLSNTVGRRGFPRFSRDFVEHLWNEWFETAKGFRKWFDREYQVTTEIPIETSNWSVWSQSRAFITSVLYEIMHYHTHAHKDWPLRLANMRVTPLEFLERQSTYKTFCPCCLHFSKVLCSGGDPPDRTGLVQWRNAFYWLCPDHMDLFLKKPEVCLPPYSYSLPQQLPARLDLRTWPENVFENGVCVVCYKRRSDLFKGKLDLAVAYNDKTYLFDDEKCLKEFMREPHLFNFEIRFRNVDKYPSLSYSELPVLGMLEQYVARPVIKALNHICRRRPIIPGLCVTGSAAVGIGLYLKVYNEKLPKEYVLFYREGDRLYNQRREKLVKYLDSMKAIRNPYLHYEEPMPMFHMLDSVLSESTESVGTAMSKLVDEIVDNVVDE